MTPVIAESNNSLVALQEQVAEEAAKIKQWWNESRWKDVKRIYNAEEIAKRRTRFPAVNYPSSFMADKLFVLLSRHAYEGTVAKTFGALDPVHVTQMAKYLDTVYVSGWQCSSTASSTNEPGPDFADYPMDTVPNKVEHLFKAQLFHDRKQREARLKCKTQKELDALGPEIDYLRPIIADADAGHGGLSAVIKLSRLFIEKGAAGIHIEDLNSNYKRCGHMAGLCVIPVQEHIDRLSAVRTCADIMSSNILLIARTDSRRAMLINSTIDKRDHYFIIGATNPDVDEPLADVLINAKNSRASEQELKQLEKEWCKKADLKLFHEAFAAKVRASQRILDKEKLITDFNSKVGPYTEKSIDEMRAISRSMLGEDVFFNWDMPRSKEGFYRYKGCTECSIMRARNFAPYSDLVWMETDSPDYDDAKAFALGVREKYPQKWLAYNLSPSFNWNKAMPPEKQKTFIQRLGKLGYVWQFITLGGLHATALAIHRFSRDFRDHGMYAYVQGIQLCEMEEEVDILKHQRWSGAEYIDSILKLASGGPSATASMGKGVTEEQFNITRSKL